MSESAFIEKKFLKAKLGNLLKQIEELFQDDYPYKDSRSALRILRKHTAEQMSRLDNFENYSDRTRNAISNNVKLTLEAHSDLMGILARSAATRNAFEVYHPFKKICSSFLGSSIHLIISSEWNYIPFTYPMNIEELPDFIIIGMPALESENVLIFPAAGHELGHSLWHRFNLKEQISSEVSSAAIEEVEKIDLRRLFPYNDKDDIKNDLISRQLRDDFINNVISTSTLIIEEIFCDIIGFQTFGKSYLHAFRYLIAPSGANIRSANYPETRNRAKIINSYAARFGCHIPEFENYFAEDVVVPDAYMNRVVVAADQIAQKICSTVFKIAEKIAQDANVHLPTPAAVERTRQAFLVPFPASADASFSEIINAAWEVFLAHSHGENLDQELNKISNLVLKSMEVAEYVYQREKYA